MSAGPDGRYVRCTARDWGAALLYWWGVKLPGYLGRLNSVFEEVEIAFANLGATVLWARERTLLSARESVESIVPLPDDVNDEELEALGEAVSLFGRVIAADRVTVEEATANLSVHGV